MLDSHDPSTDAADHAAVEARRETLLEDKSARGAEEVAHVSVLASRLQLPSLTSSWISKLTDLFSLSLSLSLVGKRSGSK